MKRSFPCSLVLAALLAAACGDKPAAAAPASPDVQKLVLAADPGAAEAVLAAKVAGARDEVTVVGRIADVVKGSAAFTLMDTEIPYCGEVNKEDHCKTPWDYCCESKERRAANSLFVEARGADGRPLTTPSLPDLRLLDKVKVKGKLALDPHGNLVLLASGLFRVERPSVPDDLRWPQ